MEKKLYVECRNSKANKPYVALVCDVGYRKILITVDRFIISELLGISIADLFSFSVGKRIDIAAFKSK